MAWEYEIDARLESSLEKLRELDCAIVTYKWVYEWDSWEIAKEGSGKQYVEMDQLDIIFNVVVADLCLIKES